jgi:hypothetical protein
MRGDVSTGRHDKRHPLDWYVDEVWCARQLAQALGGFAREREQGYAIYDPSCGSGNTLHAAWELELETIGSDLVDNFDWPAFEACPDRALPHWFSADFLDMTDLQLPATPFSVVCNPPYSYIKGIAESFVRRALEVAAGRVCMLLPTKWLASQARYSLFNMHPPQAVLQLSQRPSMPPGDRIHLMGRRAFRGGTIDYCWIMWDVQRPTRPGETRIVWLPPLHMGPVPAIEGLA